jgi:uncharacterized protein
MEPDAVEIRVVGCLLEKQRTTPEAYPLSLNALRLACNQATNRDPVVEYDEATVREGLRRLALRGWTRLASGPGSRAPKYRQLIEDALGLEPDEVALLTVLMLRGPQTPGELKQRCDRLHRIPDLSAVLDALERLVSKEYVARLERRPGQKEERYVQLLGGGVDDSAAGIAAVADADTPSPAEAAGDAGPPDERLERLERELAELREEVGRLRTALGEPD